MVKKVACMEVWSRISKPAQVFFYRLFSIYGQDNSQCCWSGMFILDPGFSIPDTGSRVKKVTWSQNQIRNIELIKILSIFNPNKLLLSSRKDDMVCLSWIPDPDFFHITIPGWRGQKSTGSRNITNVKHF